VAFVSRAERHLGGEIFCLVFVFPVYLVLSMAMCSFLLLCCVMVFSIFPFCFTLILIFICEDEVVGSGFFLGFDL